MFVRLLKSARCERRFFVGRYEWQMANGNDSTEPAVYEVDLTKRYVLRFGEQLSMEQVERIAANVDEWVKSDRPFLLIWGDVKLVRVDIPDEVGDAD